MQGGITSAKCLSIFEYYLYSAYLESMRKDIRTAYDHILISRFQNTLEHADMRDDMSGDMRDDI